MSTRNLILDVGNTATKCAIFVDNQIEVNSVYKSLTQLFDFLKTTEYKNAIISSVASPEKLQLIVNNVKNAIVLVAQTSVPIENKYHTPTTLGYDRLANVIAASIRFPNSNTLVIDAGTCLKYDFINSKNEYLGGAIAPGLQMRYKSLHTFTANLPLIAEIKTTDLIGKSTNESMQSGCFNGMLSEIEGVVLRYEKTYPNLKVILTGGDLPYLKNVDSLQKNSIFADRWLTLKGLNEIICHNNADT